MSLLAKTRNRYRTPSQLGLFLSESLQRNTQALTDSRPSPLCSRQRSAAEIAAHNRLCILQPFVIKYHRTKKPHLDFRLGQLERMLSWAIYGSPSYCPWQICKAVEVEDHLTRHRHFEGVHMEGKRGAGPTIVIDRGTWAPLPEYQDIEAALYNGRLRFSLVGDHMHGIWALIRQHDPIGDRNPVWHLTKESDAFAIAGNNNGRAFPENPRSVFSGLTISEMERLWHEGKRHFVSSEPLLNFESP